MITAYSPGCLFNHAGGEGLLQPSLFVKRLSQAGEGPGISRFPLEGAAEGGEGLILLVAFEEGPSQPPLSCGVLSARLARCL